MKFRIISDLHLDINEKYPLEIPETSHRIFTIIAGDVSGHPIITRDWIQENKKFMPEGILVAGNHIVYNRNKETISDLKSHLARFFPLNEPFSFLENNYKVIEDIVFIGATLYTDYEYGNEIKELNMLNALHSIKDFKYGNWSKVNNKIIEKLNPIHYLQMHKFSLNYIEKICKQFKDRKIVIITHHAPSGKCIPQNLINDYRNASYVSSLENFILDNENIKCWCHGHLHTSNDFMIGNCRIISNPRGYITLENNKNFDFNTIIEV